MLYFSRFPASAFFLFSAVIMSFPAAIANNCAMDDMGSTVDLRVLFSLSGVLSKCTVGDYCVCTYSSD